MLLVNSLLPLVLATSQAPQAVPDPVVILPSPLVLLDNYTLSLPSDCTGNPLGSGCHGTLVGIYYPDGKGPGAFGYTNEPLPVWINLRGGNQNPAFPENHLWHHANTLPKGYVGIDPNFPIVDPGEDYTVAEAGVATLVQYLRVHSEWLNIDPDRIFLMGRSFGAVLSLAVGLRYDYQDLNSPIPLEQHSSRPNYIIPFAAPTDLSCFGPNMAFDWLLQSYWPLSTAPGASVQQKLLDSPVWWLENPQVFGRTHTPPMCLGYKLNLQTPCGQMTDPHDGFFGVHMHQRLDDFVVQTNDPELGIRSTLIDTNDIWGYTANMTKAMNWAATQQSAALEAQVYLPMPSSPIGAAGSVQSFRAIGATPGNPVHYYFGFASGPVVVPGCNNIQTGLPIFFPIGAALADAQGQATLSVFVPPIAIGLPFVLHAVDFLACRPSNIALKTWAQ